MKPLNEEQLSEIIMNDEAERLLQRMGWDYKETETAARRVADFAQNEIDGMSIYISRLEDENENLRRIIEQSGVDADELLENME